MREIFHKSVSTGQINMTSQKELIVELYEGNSQTWFQGKTQVSSYQT